MAEQIKEKIANSKPNIKQNSLKVYLRNITKLATLLKMTPESVCEHLRQYPHDTIKSVKESELSKSMKKNLLSAALVLYGCDYPKEGVIYEQYVKALKEVNEEYTNQKIKQEVTENESKKWVKLSKLRSVIPIYKDSIKNIVEMTPETVYNNWKLFDMIQKYVVSSLYLATDALPPRRNLYANTKMITHTAYKKLSDADAEKNNWLVCPTKKGEKWRFVFTSINYKTGWKYGDQIFNLRTNSKLIPALKVWKKYNIRPDDIVDGYNTGRWLLLNPVNKEKMTSSRLSKYLAQTFSVLGGDKNISSSTIRKIYISEMYKNDTKLSKRIKTAKKMGHDHKTAQLHYEKH